MKRITYLITMLLLLSSCLDNTSLGDEKERNQKRLDVFERCMKLVPSVPGSANYDDLDDVIVQCRVTAEIYTN